MATTYALLMAAAEAMPAGFIGPIRVHTTGMLPANNHDSGYCYASDLADAEHQGHMNATGHVMVHWDSGVSEPADMADIAIGERPDDAADRIEAAIFDETAIRTGRYALIIGA